MNYKTIFWPVAFAMPVAFAIAISIPLQRERAALEAMIAQMSASYLKFQSSLQADAKQQQTIEHENNSIEADLKTVEPTLSSWQKWEIAVGDAAARLAAKGSSTAKDSTPLLNQLSYFPQLLSDPAYHNAVSALAKQDVEGKYGRLFAALALSPTDQDKLENLLTEKQMAKNDAKSLVESNLNSTNSPTPNPSTTQAEVAATSSGTVKAINEEIRATFGSQVASQISAYDGIAQFYSAMDKMETSLSYTPTPLQPAQADQVVGMLVQALGPKVFTSYWAVPNSVIDQAATVLSPPQVDVLKQIQAKQAARIQARNTSQSAGDNP